MPDRAEQRETIARARGGDAAALEALCEQYLPRLRGFFYRLGAGADADDLSQQTLLRVIEHISDFRALASGSFSAWVYRIAYNLFMDARRARPTQTLEGYDMPAPGPSPQEQVEAAQREERIGRALAELDDESRAMVVLRYYRDMKYMDIARALGVTPVRVKWRLHDALGKLGMMLKEEYGDERD